MITTGIEQHWCSRFGNQQSAQGSTEDDWRHVVVVVAAAVITGQTVSRWRVCFYMLESATSCALDSPEDTRRRTTLPSGPLEENSPGSLSTAVKESDSAVIHPTLRTVA